MTKTEELKEKLKEEKKSLKFEKGELRYFRFRHFVDSQAVKTVLIFTPEMVWLLANYCLSNKDFGPLYHSMNGLESALAGIIDATVFGAALVISTDIGLYKTVSSWEDYINKSKDSIKSLKDEIKEDKNEIKKAKKVLKYK